MKDLIVKIVKKHQPISADDLLRRMRGRGYKDTYKIKSQVWELTADLVLDFNNKWELVENDGKPYFGPLA